MSAHDALHLYDACFNRGCAPNGKAAVIGFQVVLLVDESLQQQQAWDAACTSHGAAFYSAVSKGTCAYFFANLHQHTYTPVVSFSCVHGNHACVLASVHV